MPGPVPKRSEQRRRRNKPDGPALTKVPASSNVKPPRVSPSWHPLMKDWFRSLKESGQSIFYEPSDWQTARLMAHLMSEALKSNKPVKAALLGEFNRMAASLLTTEGERRRLRIELQSAEAGSSDDGVVSVMEHYRDMFS